MIIDNSDALIKWLTGYLPPLCDADPVVLAKYCFALVKKDRPDEELKASLIEQLDVFLKSNTKSFVDTFLEVAKSKSYMKEYSSANSPTTQDANESSTDPANHEETLSVELKEEKSKHSDSSLPVPIEVSSQSCIPDSIAGNESIPNPTFISLPVSSSEDLSAISQKSIEQPKGAEDSLTTKSKKPETSKETIERRNRRSRPKDRKSRSTSRDRDHRRRSRSRNKSSRKYEDRRRRSPYFRRYNRRSRSPKWKASSPPPRRSRSRNRSPDSPKRHYSHRSRSPIPNATRQVSPNSSLQVSPSKTEEEERHSHSPEDHKDPLSGPKSVISIPPKSDLCASKPKSDRCRDYDEQGFCMRGDQCPFDHGTDPVVLEGGSLDFPSTLPAVGRGGTYPLRGLSRPHLSGREFLRPPPGVNQFEYTPDSPELWNNEVVPIPGSFVNAEGRRIISVPPPPRFTAPPPPLALHGGGRELINVPVHAVSFDVKNNLIRGSLADRLGPTSRPTHSGTSIVYYSEKQQQNVASDNCTLELRKVPSGMNTISHLNQHFAKFGTIVNVKVHLDGDPEAALVTFSSHSEANAAYRSTEAVLNNRFIKLFWHNTSKCEQPSSTTNVLKNHKRTVIRNPNKSLSKKLHYLPDSINSIQRISKNVVGRDVISDVNSSIMEATESRTLSDNNNHQDCPVEHLEKRAKLSLSNPSTSADSTVGQGEERLTSVEIRKREIEGIHKQQEQLRVELLAKQKIERQKAEAFKLKTEVENRAKQLLKEQIQHLKVLINKLETKRSSMKPEEVKVLLQTIKSLQGSVEATKTQLASSNIGSTKSTDSIKKPSPITKKSKAQLEREILDTELELYAIQSEGGDCVNVKIRLQELKNQALLLNIPIYHSKSATLGSPFVSTGRSLPRTRRGMGRGRGVYSMRRGSSALNIVDVDKRSACIQASGFEREDKIEVLAHFSTLGTIISYTWDDQTPAITIQYGTRREAEKAMTEGRNLGDRLLTLTWTHFQPCPSEITLLGHKKSVTPSQVDVVIKSKAVPHSTTDTVISTQSIEEEDEITEEEEIVEEIEGEEFSKDGYEEEEDEDNESRSWRR